MKKLLLLAAFGVAGLVSANEGSFVIIKIDEVPEMNEKVLKIKKVLPVTTSCGNTYDVNFPSSWSMQEIGSWIMSFDSFDCG